MVLAFTVPQIFLFVERLGTATTIGTFCVVAGVIALSFAG